MQTKSCSGSFLVQLHPTETEMQPEDLKKKVQVEIYVTRFTFLPNQLRLLCCSCVSFSVQVCLYEKSWTKLDPWEPSVTKCFG